MERESDAAVRLNSELECSHTPRPTPCAAHTVRVINGIVQL